MLRQAKQLNQELSAERAKLESAAASAAEDSEMIASLRTELTRGESELNVREEREQEMIQELQDLQGIRSDLQMEITSTQKKQARCFT